MKTWVRKTLSVGVLAAGALLFAPGAAHADVAQDTSDNNGILNGTQIVFPINLPQNVVGNSDALLGHANAAGIGVNWITESGHDHRSVRQHSSDNNGIANGTQFYLPFNAPLNVVGNSDALLGHSNAAGVGVNGRRGESAHTTEGHHPVNQNSQDNNGILNGTQVYAPINIPMNLCGNAFSLVGHANAAAVCGNGGRWRTESVRQNSVGNNGIANGTQIYAPISMPVNLGGNSDALLGHSNAAAVGHNESGHDGIDQNSSDNNGILNGTQIAAPINMPINFCGNALGILGEANAAGVCANGGILGDDQGHHGHHGNGGQHGHHGSNGGDNGDNAGDHGGVNGGDDGDYDGDHGGVNGGDDGDYLGDNGNAPGNGNGDTSGNGDASGYGGSDRDVAGKSAEGSPVEGLTQNLGQTGGTNFAGLGLLNTLR